MGVVGTGLRLTSKGKGKEKIIKAVWCGVGFSKVWQHAIAIVIANSVKESYW
ncbi:hypothetical protein TSUD_73140 [Trifolium subterraneum]|uniref:Uncharacterized protein n=1 Tax=Trifolium subterraneum TaxID=3900 RepID=A0A2Z6MIQ3_TRISU|nr:hypothetical protein TSUD_73140 [Trifolium subterraneum]